ncbi:GNAT family N-acetyltransferase [Thalassospira lucentensis]|uniref:GNAT family N-acetyltransferase n=1 Tax=Thalassospira lucentensis TaxID=168935 RepID=UPI003D2F4012
MTEQNFQILPGLSDSHRDAACLLFWEAFRQKLAPVMNPRDKVLAFLARVMKSDHAISAVSSDGRLLGIAGFKTADGAFVGGGLSDLFSVYGFWGGLWRGVVLEVLERDLEDNTLLMDGIFVDPDARGQGIGTALLDAVACRALEHGLAKVRLDVINTNTRARELYERNGFHAVDTQHIGLFKHVFGFQSFATMHLDLRSENPRAGKAGS